MIAALFPMELLSSLLPMRFTEMKPSEDLMPLKLSSLIPIPISEMFSKRTKRKALKRMMPSSKEISWMISHSIDL